MEKGLALFTGHLGVGVGEDEANCGEEVGLAGTVATDNDVTFRGERGSRGLVFIAVKRWSEGLVKGREGRRGARFEALDRNLFDEHHCGRRRARVARGFKRGARWVGGRRKMGKEARLGDLGDVVGGGEVGLR